MVRLPHFTGHSCSFPRTVLYAVDISIFGSFAYYAHTVTARTRMILLRSYRFGLVVCHAHVHVLIHTRLVVWLYILPRLYASVPLFRSFTYRRCTLYGYAIIRLQLPRLHCYTALPTISGSGLLHNIHVCFTRIRTRYTFCPVGLVIPMPSLPVILFWTLSYSTNCCPIHSDTFCCSPVIPVAFLFYHVTFTTLFHCPIVLFIDAIVMKGVVNSTFLLHCYPAPPCLPHTILFTVVAL